MATYSMAVYLTPTRCLPPDLINLFLSYRAMPTMCAVVLLAVAAVYSKTLPAGSQMWVRRAQAVVILAAVGWVVVLAVWVWLQAWLSIRCDLPRFGWNWLVPVQRFDQAFFPPAVELTAIGTAMLGLALLVAGVLRWLQSKPQPDSDLP